MSFQELNNKEWVFIYIYLNEIKTHYDKIIKNEGIEHIIKGPMGNKFSFFQKFDSDIIEKVLNSKKYKHLNSIVHKINPIYDIINDADPKLVDTIYSDVLNEKVDSLLTMDIDDIDQPDEDENM